MVKKRFTTEDKIRAAELHIREGMGYGGISDRYGVSTLAVLAAVSFFLTKEVEIDLIL